MATTKQLSIVIKAVDQATAPVRGVMSSLGKIGATAARVGATAAAGLGLISAALAPLLAGAGLVALVRSVDAVADSLDAIDKTATRTGLGVKQLSELKYAADLSGVEFESLALAVAQAQKNVSQFVRTGAGRAADAFRELNVPLTDSAGGIRDINELLPELFEGINNLGDAATQVELSQRIFGDSDILSLIKEGSEGFKAMTAEAAKMNVVFSEGAVKAAVRYKDSLTKLQGAWTGVRVEILTAVAPALTEIVKSVADVMARVGRAVANVGLVIAKAIGGDLRAKDAILTLVGATFQAVSSMVVVRVQRLISILWEYSRIGARQIGSAAISGFATAFEELPEMVKSVAEKIKPGIGGVIKAIQIGNDLVSNHANAWAEATEKVDAFGAAVMATDARAALDMAVAISRVYELGEGYRTIAENMELIRKRTQESAGELANWWKDFKAGGAQALEEISRQVYDTVGWSKAFVTDITVGFSQGFATAVVDVVSGTQSLKKAFSELLSSTLRQVSQLIIQMLVLKAIMGIAGAFSGPAAAPGAVPAKGFQGIGPGFNSGGWAHANSGMWIPGSGPNRDTVPAMLTRGERVLSRGEVATMGGKRGVDAAARGGGGGDVNVTVNIAMTGGGGNADPRALKRAAAEGVVEALERNPALRERLRRLA